MHKQGDMGNEAVQAATVSDSGLTIYVSPFLTDKPRILTYP